MTGVLPTLAALAVTMGLAGLLLLRAGARQSRVEARLLAVQRSLGVDRVVMPFSPRRAVLAAIARLGAALVRGGLLSRRTVADLEQTLAAAGFRGEGALPLFLGAKITMLLGLPALVLLLALALGLGAQGKWLLVAFAAVIGLLLPDTIARRLRQRYLGELERGLPDALDLMVICTEAGLSLEGAIERVAEEIAPANRSIAAELSVCASELRILADRRQALMNMAERTRLDIVRRVSVTLAQSLQFGTPLTAALRTLAAEMRQEQLTRFEARAARLPVLLTIPMIVFILPTLFLVVGGPAMLQAFRQW